MSGSDQIQVDHYIVDPYLVAEAIIDRLVALHPSAVLVSADPVVGEPGTPEQREAGPLVDHS